MGETEFDRGGLIALGVEDISESGGGSGNEVNITLSAARFGDNQVMDLGGIGARALSAATIGNNLDNRVTIRLKEGNSRHSRERVESFADSVPSTPGLGNKVTVIRNHGH